MWMPSLRTGVLRGVLDDARRRAPTLYWRGRNTLALCEWYWHRYAADRWRGERASRYDDHFWSLHDTGDWKGFAELVLRQFTPRSVIDVGCGTGQALEALRAVDPTLSLKGVDSSQPALGRARAKGLLVHDLDITRMTRSTLRSCEGELGHFDLAICLEVAEHMPPWHSTKLLRLLMTWDIIIFSAAQPNQGGVLHVNEQPARYWIQKFARRGFVLADQNAEFRERLGELALPWWYRSNTNVFQRAATA